MPGYLLTLTDEQDALVTLAARAQGLDGPAELIAQLASDHVKGLYRAAAEAAALAQVEVAASAAADGLEVQPSDP